MTSAQRLRKIVADARGDDLERCEAAFRGLDDEGMHEPFGSNGQTRAQVLAGYVNERCDWQAASDLLERLLREQGL